MANFKKIASIVFSFIAGLFLALIFYKGQREAIWFLLPIAGILRMVGGTWKKAIGRFLPPMLVGLAFYFFVGLSWWILPIVGAYTLTKTLPVSLIGDGVSDSWMNYLWFPILGFINGIACLTIAIPLGLIGTALFATLVPTVIYGLCITLSNVKATSKVFPWKFCEFMMGASALYPAALLIERYTPVVIP